MITVENDIVAGDVLLWLRGNFYDSFGSIRNGSHLFCFLFVKIGAGSKMGCVELCNFHFCCASIFCQPMKKFEFFGATRATRQRYSKRVALGTRMFRANSVGRYIEMHMRQVHLSMREFSNHAVSSMSDSTMAVSSKYTQDL